jgi:type II secretory pathway pseudopilin PulG
MPPRRTDDRGETLVELLVTIAIVGIAVVAIVGALMVAMQTSDIHRKQATGGAYVRDYAESVSRWVAAGNYTACAGKAPQPGYTSALAAVTLPAAYKDSYKDPVATYRYWDPAWTPGSAASPWVDSCVVTADAGLQQVTVRLESQDGRAAEQAVVVVRKP